MSRALPLAGLTPYSRNGEKVNRPPRLTLLYVRIQREGRVAFPRFGHSYAPTKTYSSWFQIGRQSFREGCQPSDTSYKNFYHLQCDGSTMVTEILYHILLDACNMLEDTVPWFTSFHGIHWAERCHGKSNQLNQACGEECRPQVARVVINPPFMWILVIRYPLTTFLLVFWPCP